MFSKSVELVKYALDTNIFIDAFRDHRAAAALDAFLRRGLVTTFLHSVVVQELRAGARARKDALVLQRAIFTPFERRRRIVTPSAAAFKENGRCWRPSRRGRVQMPFDGIARWPTIRCSRRRAERAA